VEKILNKKKIRRIRYMGKKKRFRKCKRNIGKI